MIDQQAVGKRNSRRLGIDVKAPFIKVEAY